MNTRITSVFVGVQLRSADVRIASFNELFISTEQSVFAGTFTGNQRIGAYLDTSANVMRELGASTERVGGIVTVVIINLTSIAVDLELKIISFVKSEVVRFLEVSTKSLFQLFDRHASVTGKRGSEYRLVSSNVCLTESTVLVEGNTGEILLSESNAQQTQEVEEGLHRELTLLFEATVARFIIVCQSIVSISCMIFVE